MFAVEIIISYDRDDDENVWNEEKNLKQYQISI
jgi:hypothetical protein